MASKLSLESGVQSHFDQTKIPTLQQSMTCQQVDKVSKQEFTSWCDLLTQEWSGDYSRLSVVLPESNFEGRLACFLSSKAVMVSQGKNVKFYDIQYGKLIHQVKLVDSSWQDCDLVFQSDYFAIFRGATGSIQVEVPKEGNEVDTVPPAHCYYQVVSKITGKKILLVTEKPIYEFVADQNRFVVCDASHHATVYDAHTLQQVGKPMPILPDKGTDHFCHRDTFLCGDLLIRCVKYRERYLILSVNICTGERKQLLVEQEKENWTCVTANLNCLFVAHSTGKIDAVPLHNQNKPFAMDLPAKEKVTSMKAIGRYLSVAYQQGQEQFLAIFDLRNGKNVLEGDKERLKFGEFAIYQDLLWHKPTSSFRHLLSGTITKIQECESISFLTTKRKQMVMLFGKSKKNYYVKVLTNLKEEQQKLAAAKNHSKTKTNWACVDLSKEI